MIALQWDQVHNWRMSQHNLLQRAPRANLVDVVSQVGGIQAQLMSAAELACHVRTEDVSATDVQNALWRDRTLIKTWAMRGTLHLLATKDFPLYVAARSVYTPSRPPSFYKYHGVSPDALDAILEWIPKTLTDTPMTRQELADAVAQQAGNPKLRELLLSGWGSMLKPSAFRGDLCFGPSQGQNVTFVRPSKWIGAWRPVDPETALQEISRRYLAIYGPASPADFARWWGITLGRAKKVFRTLDTEIVEVDIEGWPAWALASTIEQLRMLEPAPSIRMLPQFDVYTLGVSRDCEPILASDYKSLVYRSQGWISAVVLVDGTMAGTWRHKVQGAKLAIQVNMFAPCSARVTHDIEEEAQRLDDFLGAKVELTYGEVT